MGNGVIVKRFPELDDRSQRGSKPRCHLFTDGMRAEVAGRLTALVRPYGTVLQTDHWMPEGFDNIEEVQLHKPNDLISKEMSRKLENWWFEVGGGLGPTWDLVSQCVLGNGSHRKRALLLVEAKAHRAELEGESDGKMLKSSASSNSCRNHERIGSAIEGANVGLCSFTAHRGWKLSRDSCYQMANRFAWAWKLASLGKPVVLVYLGFLNAIEMSDKSDPFNEYAEWDECVKTHAKCMVPEEAWNHSWKASDGTFFVPRIMTVCQSITSVRMSP